jgi:two-component system, OmpR family, phosphate regulon sensor histidine kinase PhoR
MSNRILRIIFILSVVCAILMIATQFYWVRQSYDLEKKIFDSKVKKSLDSVAKSILRSNENYSPIQNAVKKETGLYYTVRVGDNISPISLEELLKRELKRESITADFEYVIFSCDSSEIQHSRYVYMSPEREGDTKDATSRFPVTMEDNNYFGVIFPNRNVFLSGEMNKWIISSALLLAVLLILAYALFIIFKQKRLSEIQKNFVNNMTHEFKTPLATMKIASEVLKNPIIVNNPQRLLNYATLISNETAHLTAQVERVLQMAKSTKEKLELSRTELNVNELMDELTSMTYAPLVRSRGGELNVTYSSENIIASVDKLHFKNLIGNLLDNAIKYCKEIPKINVHVFTKDGKLHIKIKDNGIGISDEHLKHVFKRFFRVPTGNVHDVKGFGLGLNYVKLICLRQGGNISVTSTLGKGSEFSIFIPLKEK